MKTHYFSVLLVGFGLALCLAAPAPGYAEEIEKKDGTPELIVSPREVDEEGYYAPCKKEATPELYDRCVERNEQLIEMLGGERAKYTTTEQLEARKRAAVEAMIAEEQANEESLDEIASRLKAEREQQKPTLIKDLRQVEQEENVRSIDDLRNLVLGKGGTEPKDPDLEDYQ